MNRISVIIPTYNRVDTIERTLACMLELKRKPDQVVVVDQTSDPGKAERIEALCTTPLMNIRYIHEDIPSLTRARNIGLRNVDGDVVVFMDDDVDVSNNTFELVEEIFSNPQIALLGGFNKTTSAPWSLKSVFWGRARLGAKNRGVVTKACYGRFPAECKQQVETEWAMGFFFVIRRDCVKRWNLTFDEKLLHYAFNEDLDFTYRYYLKAKEEGMKCIYDSRVVVDHRSSKEYRLPSRKLTFMKSVHRRYLTKKLFDSKWAMFLTVWSDYGDAVQGLLKGEREYAKDCLEAIRFARTNSLKIEKGEMCYNQFML